MCRENNRPFIKILGRKSLIRTRNGGERMRLAKKVVRPRGDARLELLRKTVHALVGLTIVLLFQGGILDTNLFGLLTIVFGGLVLYNYRYERELLLKIISINRPDATVPGLDLLAYFVGAWLVLFLFPPEVAFAAIMILAIGDPLAHLVSRSFSGTKTMVSRDSYWYGIIAGTLAGTFAAWVFVPSLLFAFLASAIAMFVEAGEFRIADHHIDDNLTIPLVSGVVLWVLLYAI